VRLAADQDDGKVSVAGQPLRQPAACLAATDYDNPTAGLRLPFRSFCRHLSIPLSHRHAPFDGTGSAAVSAICSKRRIFPIDGFPS
jgi:hypothetical protein